MEVQTANSLNNSLVSLPVQTNTRKSSNKAFIEANTIESTLGEIKRDHIIPVFIKDNEPVISQADFIQGMYEVTREIFEGEDILEPTIRLSHPIKGRVPDAKHKPAADLLENEKTLYYERMAFVIEIPTVFDTIDDNTLSLMVGGVKALNLDNLYNRKGADEHFKIFIGFKNTVCTNLCVWTDGFMNDVRVNSLGMLKSMIKTLFNNYNANYQMQTMRKLSGVSLTEQQFAQIMGKLRLFQHLPRNLQSDIAPLHLGDSQLNAVAKDYYKDDSFCRNDLGEINLWKMYNLLTGANKSTYIDNFIDRSVNAYNFVEKLRFCLENKTSNWYLN